VNGPGGDDLKNQQVERALREIGSGRHFTPRASTCTTLRVEAQGVSPTTTQGAMEAMLRMKKIDIRELERAVAEEPVTS
jgi:hypothetical protein